MRLSPKANDPTPALSITHCERCHIRKLLELGFLWLATELIAWCLFSDKAWLQRLLVSSLSRDMGLHTVDLRAMFSKGCQGSGPPKPRTLFCQNAYKGGLHNTRCP
jgi:hypothetical protein